MLYLSVPTDTLHAREYISALPVQRATWWNVLLWSAADENGGRIRGAAAITDRQWQQMCGVRRREVLAAQGLLSWDGDDLVVWNYPAAKEQEVKSKRLVAQRNGTFGGRRAMSLQPTPEPTSEPKSVTTPEPTSVTTPEPTLVPTLGPTSASVMECNVTKGKHAAHAREAARTLPECLNTPQFRHAWEAWLVHWAATWRHGSPMPNATADAHLRLLLPLGPAKAIAALANSISRNLREPAEAFHNANDRSTNSRSFEHMPDYSGVTDK